jgi:hypothetical protein
VALNLPVLLPESWSINEVTHILDFATVIRTVMDLAEDLSCPYRIYTLVFFALACYNEYLYMSVANTCVI